MTDLAAVLESRFAQAVVAGLVVALGWLVNGWQNRRMDRRRRAERLRDVHRALFAEIGAWLATVGSLDRLEDGRARIVAQMQADAGFVPFFARVDNDRVFAAILGEIHVLPRSSIDIVVAFYGQLAALRALVDDMRSARFAALSAARRIAVYEDYVRITRLAFDYGQVALRLIEIYSRDGHAAARAEQDRLRQDSSALINSPSAADPSDRRQESGSA